jgi:nicotinamide-nucleotide amidase
MNAEILAVGTELLMGQISNTNAQYISNRLSEVGINVYYHSVVGDNPARLKGCLNIAVGRSDVIIMTGGLGPTKDDLTKETVAEFFGLKLVLHDEILNTMKAYFARMNRPMAENNVKQAYLPEGSRILMNGAGTAPGCIIEKENKTVVMLPGPPSEMKPMFEENVIPYFKEKSEYKLESKFLRIFGIGESDMENVLMDLVDSQTNPTIAPYAKDGEVTLRVTARYKKEGEAADIIMPIVNEIKRRLGNMLYSTENKNLEEVTAELLMTKGMTLSAAESCTGGLVSSKLTDIPGISKVFNRGIVCYSNQSKIENLGVRPETLDKYGAVSMETAVEMAQGMRRLSGTDIAVSITGIAGPDGGMPEKPVGLVYVAVADKTEVRCKELMLSGSRTRIRNVTALHAFDMIRRCILKLPVEC